MKQIKLVVDANIIFSVLIKNGFVRNLLFTKSLDLYIPSYIFLEIQKHLKLLCKKTNIEEKELFSLLNEIIFYANIKIIDDEKFSSFTKKAELFSPDKYDSTYLGLCLFLKCGLWSEDKLLKDQNIIKILNTKELSSLINQRTNQ
jgi:predicted nucleic acid-binding protein